MGRTAQVLVQITLPVSSPFLLSVTHAGLAPPPTPTPHSTSPTLILWVARRAQVSLPPHVTCAILPPAPRSASSHSHLLEWKRRPSPSPPLATPSSSSSSLLPAPGVLRLFLTRGFRAAAGADKQVSGRYVSIHLPSPGSS